MDENFSRFSPNWLFRTTAIIAALSDCLSAIGFGILILFSSALLSFFEADPFSSYIGVPVFIFCLAYAAFFAIALISWINENEGWQYVISVLGLLHICGFTFLVTQWGISSFGIFFWISLALNSILIGLTILEIVRVRKTARSKLI